MTRTLRKTCYPAPLRSVRRHTQGPFRKGLRCRRQRRCRSRSSETRVTTEVTTPKDTETSYLERYLHGTRPALQVLRTLTKRSHSGFSRPFLKCFIEHRFDRTMDGSYFLTLRGKSGSESILFCLSGKRESYSSFIRETRGKSVPTDTGQSYKTLIYL